MSILNRDDILGASDIKLELVPVMEWGGDVWVKGMTGAERDRFEAGIVRAGTQPGQAERYDLSNLRAKLCSMTICDEDGKLLFTKADILALSQKSSAALQRVFKVAQKLSGVGDEDIAELAKGLEENPLEDSASD